jgi:hypothetical protein
MAFRDLEIPCPACGAVERRTVAESVDAAEHPELRQQILDDTFQRFACPGCAVRVAVDGPLLVLDLDRHHWIELFPAPWQPRWRALERASFRRFRSNLVEHAPPMLQERAGAFVVRTVFGLDALREKLVAFDAGIDDRALEAVKLGILRSRPELASYPGLQIRLRAVKGASLRCSVHDGRSALGELHVPGEQLDAAASDAWLATRQLFLGGYVDLGRLLDRPAPGAARLHSVA